jgi:hypothetical protein
MNAIASPDLEALYRAFANIRKPKDIPACSCCMDDEAVEKLLKPRLRDISREEVGAYARKVFLTVGSEGDFLYFLPRILEVLAISKFENPEITGMAIGTFGWENFTEGQQEAISAYCDARLRTEIEAEKPDGGNIDSWLCFASFFWPGWTSYLEMIVERPASLIALREWYGDWTFGQRVGESGFWESSLGRHYFSDWFASERVAAAIRKAYGL